MHLRSRWHRWLIRLVRSSAAMALIVAYLAAAIGIPLPVRVDKDRSRPFPCQDHACGCQNAEQCWHQCCCYSPEEKLVWARAHHIEPPPELCRRVASLAWNSPRQRDHAKCGDSSCPCANKDSASARSPQEASQPAQSPVPWVLAVLAHKCQGHGMWCQAVFASLPPPAVITWSYDWRPAGHVAQQDLACYHFASVPPTPPPRLV